MKRMIGLQTILALTVLAAPTVVSAASVQGTVTQWGDQYAGIVGGNSGSVSLVSSYSNGIELNNSLVYWSFTLSEPPGYVNVGAYYSKPSFNGAMAMRILNPGTGLWDQVWSDARAGPYGDTFRSARIPTAYIGSSGLLRAGLYSDGQGQFEINFVEEWSDGSQPPLTGPTTQILTSGYWTGSSFTVTWSAYDPDGIQGYSYALDAAPGNAINSWGTTYGLSGLSGPHVFFVKALDGAGNWGAPASYTFRVDSNPPPPAFSVSRAAPWFTQQTITLAWNASNSSASSAISTVHVAVTYLNDTPICPGCVGDFGATGSVTFKIELNASVRVLLASKNVDGLQSSPSGNTFAVKSCSDNNSCPGTSSSPISDMTLAVVVAAAFVAVAVVAGALILRRRRGPSGPP